MTQYYTYIYKDKNIPFYVGKGSIDSRGRSRVYVHLKRKDHHPLTYKIQKMLRKNNQPEIEIINVTCENTALRLETFLIAQYGRKDLGTGSLLNLTDGGEGNNYWKGKFGKDHPMFGRFGKDHPAFGYKHTKETKKNQSEGMKGKQNSLGYKFPIVTCPHCGKSGVGGVMYRWHFANCKNR